MGPHESSERKSGQQSEKKCSTKKVLIRNAEIMQRRMNNSSRIYRHVYESAWVDPVY